mmetsp:Transcript_44658/g.129189  ORF Transcript_44658/g.129189 Transcript_44658/m.129189 type:complete len:87 (+) Transcript_44658:1-261(+)
MRGGSAVHFLSAESSSPEAWVNSGDTKLSVCKAIGARVCLSQDRQVGLQVMLVVAVVPMMVAVVPMVVAVVPMVAVRVPPMMGVWS